MPAAPPKVQTSNTASNLGSRAGTKPNETNIKGKILAKVEEAKKPAVGNQVDNKHTLNQ
jgi:hypothetical protein